MTGTTLRPVAVERGRWRRFRHEWLAAAYLLLYLVARMVAWPLGGTWLAVTNALYFPMGALAIWSQGRLAADPRADRRTRQGWGLLAASSAVIWMAGIVWTAWLARNPEGGSPAWIDRLGEMYIPFAILGFLRFPADDGFTSRDRRARLDVALLVVGGVALSWNFGLHPLLQQQLGPHALADVLNVLGEWLIVLAASVAYVRAGNPVIRNALALALGAHMLYVLSNFFWTSALTDYVPGYWIDSVWFMAWVLRWAAARYALAARRGGPADASRARGGIAPTVFVAGAYTLLIFAVYRRDMGGAAGIALAASVMTALLLVRQSVELAENRRLAQATAAQAARFRSIISHASDFVLVVDADLAVTYRTPSLERAAAVATGAPFVSLLHPDDRDQVLAWLRVVAGSAAPHRARMRTAPGDWGEVELRAQDLRDDPVVRGFVVNGRDISGEVALEVRLRHAQKLGALHDMAGRIAHAFNNALASIQGHAELLAHEVVMQGTTREDVDAIRAAAERGAGITRQLLGFSGRHAIQPVLLDATRVTRALVPTLQRLLPPGVALTVGLQDDAGAVLFDRSHFEQVLVNLVANARDAMPDGGTLRVEVRRERGDALRGRERVVLRVADSGTGIAAADLERIFEPFYTTKAPGRGTGLGLAMVRAIVARAGGTIGVESVPGRGTTFAVALPRAAESSGAPTTPGDVPALAAQGTILLVDDDDAVRRATRRMLERAGFVIVEATGGAMALHLMAAPAASFDVLVTDMTMPNVSGRDVIDGAQRLRPDLPIVCITGFAAEHEGASPLAPAVSAIIAKPFNAAALVGAVAAAISAAGSRA